MKEKIVNSSLASKIRYSYLIFFIPAVMFMVFAFTSIYYANARYNDIIQSAVVASKFGLEFKDDFDYETYLLIVGNKSPEETTLHNKIYDASKILDRLEELAVSDESMDRLASLRKYLDNLENYTNRIIENLSEADMYEENIEIWENDVQIVTALINEGMNEYIYYEIQNIQVAQSSIEMRYRKIVDWLVVAMIVIGGILMFLSFYISQTIASPIKEINEITNQVASGDFSVRTHIAKGQELKQLSTSLNQMIEKIENLVDEVRTEQINLRQAELELLQSQINPHFLYNTLDTIVWLAETGDQKKVVSMVESLSDFFRISLNQGKDIITLDEEIGHVTSYLEIQGIRYQDILSYEITREDSLKDYLIPKISLQPLVENALYHGIKNKRGKGKISIKTIPGEKNYIIEISDNGIGMTKEQLEKIRSAVYEPNETERSSYGLYNVNERIRLKYGNEYGLSFDSIYREGTVVRVLLPYVK